MKRAGWLILVVCLLGAGTGFALEPQTELSAARAAAQSAGHDILVMFLGSNWSEASRRFDQSVLQNAAVGKAIAGQYVVLRIDQRENPTETEQQLAKRNKDLKLTVWNFPAVALLDREGRAYAWWTGLARETPAGLLAKFDEGRRIREQRDAAWALAAQATGVEKARQLGRGLEPVDPDLVRACYEKVVKEIQAADPDDASGYHRRYTFRMNAFFEGTIEPLFKDKSYAEAVVKVDAELRNPVYTLEQRQQLLGARFQVLRRWEKKTEAEQALREIIKLNATNHMGAGAKGYLHYLNDPIEVHGEWAGEQLRPWYQEWRMDVSGVVTSAGTYNVNFVHTGGGGLQVSNVALVVGSEVVDRVSDGRGKNQFQVRTVTEHPGPRVQLIMHAKAGGWLDSRGRIEVIREPDAPP